VTHPVWTATFEINLSYVALRLPRLPSPGEDLPVAASMQELLATALADLPPVSRRAVRLAALLAAPSPGVLEAAGVSLLDFDPAEEAGVLTVTLTAVQFAHPMYATAVGAGTPPGVRRRAGRRPTT